MKIEKSNFTFRPMSIGLYQVSYESPVTGIKWSALVDDMELIDKTKNTEYPKRRDLETLKFHCKRYWIYKEKKDGTTWIPLRF